MPISTNGTIITRVAGALYGEYMSNASYNEIALVSTIAPATVAANFLTSDFAGRTDAQLATTVLTNLGLNSIAGLNNWLAAQMTAAGSTATLKGAKLVELLNSFSMMTTDATYGSFATTFNNNVSAALTYSQTPGASGGIFTTAAATASAAAAAAAAAATAAAAAAAAAPVTFPLTNGSDVRTTGVGNDTFNALWSSTTGMTFATNDILDGGAGNDTLFIQVGATGVHGPATLSNIETITTNFSQAATVNLLGATGVTTIESNGSSADAAFTNIGSATTALRVSNTANSANFGFTAGAVAGSADTANVTLNAVTGGTLTLTSGFETLSLTPTGAADTLTGLSLGTSSASTVRVLGDQALNIGTVATAVTLPTTVTNFDASGNTASGAGVVATFGANTTSTSITGGTGNDTFNISNITTSTINVAGGAGNDTVIDNASISAVTTIAGGDGTADVLVTTAASAEGYSTPATRTITGIERLTLSTPGTAGITLTTANVDTGINTVTLGAGTATVASGIGAAAAAFAATSGAYGITGPAGTLAVNVGSTLGGTLTLTDTGTAVTDAATLTNSGVANANVFNGAAVTSTGYETLTISSGSASTTNAAAQTLGAVTLTPDTGGTTAVNFTGANNVSVGAITAVTVSASGMTGAGTFTQTAAAGSTTTSITGTGNADVILGGSAASSLTGGAGADTITGGAGNDTISGGDGADSITGGNGRDNLTGGSGADIFVFAQPASTAVTSNQAAPDTITDFVAGTDKISLGQSVTAFLGNYVSLSSAQAAATADTRTNLAFFVSGDNTLYVSALANGALNAVTDTAIYFTPGTVTSLSSTDILQIGSQGTGNTTIALTAAAANLTTTANTNASAVTTASDDAISSTAAFLSNSTITGGTGNDTLTISTDPTAAGATGTGSTTFTLAAAGAGTGAVVSGVEVISLTAGNTANTLTVPNDVNLAVRNASSTATAIVQLGSGTGQTFTGTGSGVQTVTLGGASQSVTTGTGADQITSTASRLLASTIAGGAGSDTLTISDLSTAGGTTSLTLSSTAASAAGALMTGIETVAVTVDTGFGTLSLVPDAPLTVNFTGAVAETVAGTGSTITIGKVAAQNLTLSGSSNFVVTGGTTGAISSSGTGTLTVTGGDGAFTLTSSGTASLDTGTAGTLGTRIITLAGNGNKTVTGLGSVAANAVTLTEAAAANTGTLTVTTVDTGASTITQAATGTSAGAFVLNANGGAGAGVTTLTALLSHTSQTINMSSSSAVTVAAASTALAYTINATDANAHIYIGDSNTAAIDTFTGGSAVDTVTLSLGADIFASGGGADVYNITGATDTGLASGFGAGLVALANGSTVNVAQMDKLSGLVAGFTIVITSGADADVGDGGITGTIIRNGGTAAAANAAAPGLMLITGSYDATAQLFTVSAGGTSTLFVYDDNFTGTGGDYRGVVLVGYVDTNAADTFGAAAVANIQAMTFTIV